MDAQGLLWGFGSPKVGLLKPLIEMVSLSAVISSMFDKLNKIYFWPSTKMHAQKRKPFSNYQ